MAPQQHGTLSVESSPSSTQLRGDARSMPCAEAEFQPDDAATNCTLCHDEFTLVKRRHHCRWCGCVACAKCTESKHRLKENSSSKQRVCKQCDKAAADFESKLSGSEDADHPSSPNSDTDSELPASPREAAAPVPTEDKSVQLKSEQLKAAQPSESSDLKREHEQANFTASNPAVIPTKEAKESSSRLKQEDFKKDSQEVKGQNRDDASPKIPNEEEKSINADKKEQSKSINADKDIKDQSKSKQSAGVVRPVTAGDDSNTWRPLDEVDRKYADEHGKDLPAKKEKADDSKPFLPPVGRDVQGGPSKSTESNQASSKQLSKSKSFASRAKDLIDSTESAEKSDAIATKDEADDALDLGLQVGKGIAKDVPASLFVAGLGIFLLILGGWSAFFIAAGWAALNTMHVKRQGVTVREHGKVRNGLWQRFHNATACFALLGAASVMANLKDTRRFGRFAPIALLLPVAIFGFIYGLMPAIVFAVIGSFVEGVMYRRRAIRRRIDNRKSA